MDRPRRTGVLGQAWAGPEGARLAELHASAIEDHAVALIIARRWAEAIAELKAHVSMNPLRDRAVPA